MTVAMVEGSLYRLPYLLKEMKTMCRVILLQDRLRHGWNPLPEGGSW